MVCFSSEVQFKLPHNIKFYSHVSGIKNIFAVSLLYISYISNISLLQYLGGLVECVYDRSTGRTQVKDSNSKLSLHKGLLQK